MSNLLDVPSNNNKDNLGLVDIDKQKSATLLVSTSQNRLLSELFSTFRKITFSKSEFSTDSPVLETRYKYLESQKENLYYPFNDQVDCTLAYYFVELETIKCNINKFFF